MACMVNRKRLWTHRIMLESMCHESNIFVTLTYNDEHLKSDSLIPRDLTLYLKRLRERVSPVKFRYYAVGEYGETSQRPHFHLAIFGLNACQEVTDAWNNQGFVGVGTLTFASAAYVGGYVTKKLVNKKNLGDRYPEFARMSNRPGIGAYALDKLLDILTSPAGKYLLSAGDVPKRLMYGNKSYPLGRYLVNKLREGYGVKDEIVAENKEISQRKLQALSYLIWSDSPDSETAKELYKQMICAKPEQELTLLKRQNLKKGTL